MSTKKSGHLFSLHCVSDEQLCLESEAMAGNFIEGNFLELCNTIISIVYVATLICFQYYSYKIWCSIVCKTFIIFEAFCFLFIWLWVAWTNTHCINSLTKSASFSWGKDPLSPLELQQWRATLGWLHGCQIVYEEVLVYLLVVDLILLHCQS